MQPLGYGNFLRTNLRMLRALRRGTEMCGRFNVVSDPLMRLVNIITGEDLVIKDRLNLAPTEDVPVLLKTRAGDWTVRDMRWWLVPRWSDSAAPKRSMFNARSETIAKSRAFRDPFERRRCVVLASGYYEWVMVNGVKMPNYIAPVDDLGFAFAGLWDRWQGEHKGGAVTLNSCTIITAAASPGMDEIHSRMPVALSSDQVERWIDNCTERAELIAMLAPELRIRVSVTPMSTYVNNSRNKGEECLEALGESSILH